MTHTNSNPNRPGVAAAQTRDLSRVGSTVTHTYANPGVYKIAPKVALKNGPLTIQKGFLKGYVDGHYHHCPMRPAQQGVVPPAGDYAIQPPVNDPVYGSVALMVSIPDRVVGGAEGPATVFELCDKPVVGKDGIVVTHGFARLMDDLQKAGGAQASVEEPF
jgi:hypothetical protein